MDIFPTDRCPFLNLDHYGGEDSSHCRTESYQGSNMIEKRIRGLGQRPDYLNGR